MKSLSTERFSEQKAVEMKSARPILIMERSSYFNWSHARETPQ